MATEQMEENLRRSEYTLERRGMKLSRSKTESMSLNERDPGRTMKVQGLEIRKVKDFKCWSRVHSRGGCGNKGEEACGSRLEQLENGIRCSVFHKSVSKNQRKGKMVVGPAMSPGLETEALSRRQEAGLAETKMLSFPLNC